MPLAALLATTALLVSAQPGAAQGAGRVVGDVRLSGTAPAAKLVKVARDTEVCGSEKEKVVGVALGAGNGLANAVVTVVDVKVATANPPSTGRSGGRRRC